MGAGDGAGATEGVLGDTGTAGDSERGGVADGSARVPEECESDESKFIQPEKKTTAFSRWIETRHSRVAQAIGRTHACRYQD